MRRFFAITSICIMALMGAVSVIHAQTAATAGINTTSTNSLQSQIDANNAQIQALNQQIAEYQAKLQQIGADKKTLQAAINSLNLQKNKVQAQVTITERQISTTQIQIAQLGGQITDIQQSIANAQTALGGYLRNLQKDDNQSFMVQLLTSHTLDEMWGDVNATIEMQQSIQNQMQALRAQEENLANSKAASQEKQATLTSQQKQLTSQQQTLVQTVQSKNQLLAETNAQESNYEKLLAAAEAELNAFTAFTQNAGGSKLLGNQTVCDSWGCYYNQRDSAWGSNPLNGTKFTLASDGCLVTSMAMVMTHYGYKDVTPVTINTNPANFASYYPAYLLATITVDGVSATRKAAAIDATLTTGNPVVVGLHAYGGTHFVVLVSGRRGNYLMRDPYIPNGNNIPFSDHYTLRSIYAITKVVIS